MSELKPCPFCGSDNVVADNLRVRCNNGECLAILTSPPIGNKTLAKALWNSRPSRPTDHADLIRRARDMSEGPARLRPGADLIRELADALEQRDGLRERVKKVAHELHCASLPDPYDERDTCPRWLADKMREASNELKAALRGQED